MRSHDAVSYEVVLRNNFVTSMIVSLKNISEIPKVKVLV